MQFYVFNPAPKLRLLSTLFYKGSKRILRNGSDRTSSSSLQSSSPKCTAFTKLPIEALRLPAGNLIQDTEYHADSQKGYCVFQVENTLFNVHQVLLLREPSAFSDMLSLPQPFRGEITEETPIFLTDPIHKFRDFLWALHAPPNDLFRETGLDRLLNVAELVNKYSFSSFEAWAIERIYSLVKLPIPSNPLCAASVEQAGRVVDVAILCRHEKLQDLVTQYLVSRTLWYNVPPEEVLVIAERHGLRTLAGVCYYKQLINMEYVAGRKHNRVTQVVYPPNIDAEKRMRFSTAHDSLVNHWERLRATPPKLSSDRCPDHRDCALAWQIMWFQTTEVDEALRSGSADLLGRMKSVMLGLRKLMADAPSMSMQCKLEALEAITSMRDETIDGLIVHFQPTSSRQ